MDNICVLCSTECEKGDKDVLVNEYERNFGLDYTDEDAATLCDTCYNQFMAYREGQLPEDQVEAFVFKVRMWTLRDDREKRENHDLNN